MCPAGYFGSSVLRHEKKKPLGFLPMVAASGGEFQQIRPLSRVAPNGRSKWRRVSTNQTIINSDVYMNLEVSSGSVENIPIKEVFKQLKCTRKGLSTEKGEKGLQIFGFNKLEEKKAQLFNSFVS
ncbi:hypothetical protein RHGRI_000384 [Rhododendron griersonianum]|uniref:Cation-transporting P-type ATPase N-terminal domain-containing protein n=1 Tax=Rhododendron griersonianum TaxID=479676 RepID=A0AAV6LGR5_9ERIC|nr:hypothetical protein RHGRI_000384 [Rhododendron griersonianum]